MKEQEEILAQIKTAIQEIIPDTKVFLFGSRATGKVHEESDWDILVLTEKKYPKSVKLTIHDKLFSLSLSIGSPIQFIVATKDEWENYPGYYSLQLGIGNDLISL